MIILGAWLLADFLSGIIHWIEDKRLNPSRIAFLDRVRIDNDLHHFRPSSILRFTWLENIGASAMLTLPLSLCLYAIHAPKVLWLAIFFSTFGNLTHRFAHIPQLKRNRLLKFIQRTGFFISYEQHLRHHFNSKGRVSKRDASITYCTMTGWLNPILDKIKFFNLLDWIYKRMTGAKK